MKTKASFKSHPFHQMLVPFPIAFLLGGVLFDLLGFIFSNQTFWITAAYLISAGIITGVLAAIPGFIDYLFSVPPDSTAKKRATNHLIINLTSVSFFLIALILRAPFENQPGTEIFILEVAGAGLLFGGAWLGGTLVLRNFIGPDHRYAGAGKWKEVNVITNGSHSVIVAKEDELKINQMMLLHADNRRIVLGKTEDSYVAFDDSCTHRGGSLASGVMICDIVQCLWHGSQFNVKSGEMKTGPAEKNISTYKVDVKNGNVYLYL